MSNRAERLSDRAKRGSDSVARLDSPSDRRSRKGKYNQGKKEVRPSLYFLYWPYSCLRRDTFFCSDTICPTISLNRLYVYVVYVIYGCPQHTHYLWMPPARTSPCFILHIRILFMDFPLIGRHLWMPPILDIYHFYLYQSIIGRPIILLLYLKILRSKIFKYNA